MCSGLQSARSTPRYQLDKTPEHALLADEVALSYLDATFIAIARRAFNLVHHTEEIGRSAGRSRCVRVVRFGALQKRPDRDVAQPCGLFGPRIRTRRF